MVTAVNIPQHHEDAAARSMLIGVVLLFAGVLMAGWYLLIAPSLLNNMSFLALPLSIGVGVFAVVIARGVASELLRVRANPEALNRHTWKMWLVLLFLLSALGTLNAGIYFGEGPAVLTESLSTALQDFQIL